MKLKSVFAFILAIVIFFCGSSPTKGANSASDYAGIDQAWFNGGNGGYGFGAWLIVNTSTNVNQNGEFLWHSLIDDGGWSWGIYANTNQIANAFRPFTDGPLLPGQQFSIFMLNNAVDVGGTVGFDLQDSAQDNRFEFYYTGGGADYTINVRDIAQNPHEYDTGVPFTANGLEVVFTQFGTNQFSVDITPVGGATTTMSGVLAASDIANLRLFNNNAGFDPPHDLYFSYISISTAPPIPQSPGTSSDTGYTVTNLTPTFTWTGVSGANSYGLYISHYPYGSANIIYSNTTLTSTSLKIPSGYLQSGTKYRWNMTSLDSNGNEGNVSARLYFQTPGSAPAQIVLHGRVTDTNGIALSDATVSAMIYLTSVAQATTDTNGNYQMPTLGAGVYDLAAWDAIHQTSMRGLTLIANTAEQDFQLTLLPQTPTTQQVSRSATVDYTVGDLMGSVLRIYNGSMFVPVTTNNWPSASLMTIVMTHGWILNSPDSSITNTSFDRWPTNTAAELLTQNVTPANANILAWDWRFAAMSLDPGIPADRTPVQGTALGEALLHFLGANYSQPLHFMGHSLGTLVNASAINYLHGESMGTGDNSPTPWKNNLVQVTLFDQAQLAELVGAPPIYQSALPSDFTWADNYKSLVGIGDFSDAVNVNLQKGILTSIATSLNPMQIADDSHGYPMDWYGMSISFPTDQYNPLGFKRSYEYAPLLFPPSDIQTGSTYHQTPTNYDELALEPVTAVSSLGLFPDAVVQTTVDTIQFTTGVTVQTVDTAQNDASSLFNYVSGIAAQGGQTVVNAFNSSSSLGLFLTTGVVLPSPLVKSNQAQSLGISSGSATSPFPMVWLPIQFPTNATVIAFDFMEEGDPADDVLVCGIGTNNLFSLEAKYVPTNQISTSRLIDVSAWAGTTNELFFGFMGGTSTNATLQIQNIRFYSLQPPQLSITQTGNATLLAWPSIAGGYSVVTTTNLATLDWETVSNIPAISGNSYVLTNSWPDQMRFFRLQQQ